MQTAILNNAFYRIGGTGDECMEPRVGSTPQVWEPILFSSQVADGGGAKAEESILPNTT